MLIQMPILFALYRVFLICPAYIVSVLITGNVFSWSGRCNYEYRWICDKIFGFVMTKFNVVTSSGLIIKNVADTLNGASGKDLANYITDLCTSYPQRGISR